MSVRTKEKVQRTIELLDVCNILIIITTVAGSNKKRESYERNERKCTKSCETPSKVFIQQVLNLSHTE